MVAPRGPVVVKDLLALQELVKILWPCLPSTAPQILCYFRWKICDSGFSYLSFLWKKTHWVKQNWQFMGSQPNTLRLVQLQRQLKLETQRELPGPCWLYLCQCCSVIQYILLYICVFISCLSGTARIPLSVGICFSGFWSKVRQHDLLLPVRREHRGLCHSWAGAFRSKCIVSCVLCSLLRWSLKCVSRWSLH